MGVGALGCGHRVSEAATVSTAIEPQQEPGPLGCSTVDEGINAQRSMSADEPRLDPLDEPKLRPPHQRAIGKHPQVLRRVKSIRVHGCDIKELAAARKSAQLANGTRHPRVMKA